MRLCPFAKVRPPTSRRNRRTIITAAVILVFCFLLFILHSSLKPFSPTTKSLEGTHDSESLEETSVAPDGRKTTRILLVSAMFPLAKSKHSAEDYEVWISNFLQSITTDIYFYTTPDFASVVQRVRGPELSITIDTSYASPFDVQPMKGLEAIYAEMQDQDREKFRHSPDLYAVWNSKPFLLDAAVKSLAKRGKVYDYAFWNDAGSFRREHKYKSWPDSKRVDQIWIKGSELTGTKAEDLLFFPICGVPDSKFRNWKEDMGPVDNEVSEGSFFGGSPKTVEWWSHTFYAYHDHYISLGLFVGKDQTLINALFLLFPERLITVWYRDPLAPAHAGIIPFLDEGYLGACGGEWWYFQFWLSGRSERDEIRMMWINRTSWVQWEWWASRQKCRLSSVLALKDVLQRQFGKSWEPPRTRTTVWPS